LKSQKNISIKKKKAVAVISNEDKLKEANQKIKESPLNLFRI